MTESRKRPGAGRPDRADTQASTDAAAAHASGLSDEQRALLRTVLQNQRRQLIVDTDEQSRLSAEGRYGREHSGEPHALENAEITSELQVHANQEIALIDAALQRMVSGSYGVCCDCGDAIGFPRLEAYPMARRCIACKRVYEEA